MRVAVSGGFDPLHVGHLEFFHRAKEVSDCDTLLAIVETDDFVRRKHKVLMPQTERVEILRQCRLVDVATINLAADGDCSSVLEKYRPEVYAVGSDHADFRFPEYKTCMKLGITVIAVDTPKRSSSKMLADVQWGNPPLAVSMVAIRNARVLLVQRRDTNLWELPGGFVEEGESLEEGLCREVSEELSVRIVNRRYFTSAVAKYGDGRDVLSTYFLADLIDEPIIQVPGEVEEWEWFADVSKLSFYCDADRNAIAEYYRRADPCG